MTATLRTAAALVLFFTVVPAIAQVEKRDPLPVPDLPGYRTLKADLHLHSVFSDGNVWPTVHVMEAWRDGLDVISLTEHVEYRPHKADVTTGLARAYAVAKPLADELGILLIPGVEITRPVSKEAPGGATAHFNALFVTDPAALDVPELFDALRIARDQGAFTFWNHPGFRVDRAEWYPPIAAAHAGKLFHGMELVNGPNFYPEAFPWIEEKGLTILGNSDAHDPMPPRERAGVRPMTLIFARAADAAGVKDALVARRTAAWMGGRLWGAEDHLRALWNGAVTFEPATVRPGTFVFLRARNASALPFQFVVRRAPAWIRPEPAAIAVEGDSMLRVRILPDAPPGRASIEIEIELTNVHPGPGRNLIVRMPLRLEVVR